MSQSVAFASNSTIAWSAAGLLIALSTTGCSEVAYLAQSASGHIKIMQASRPMEDWLADDRTPPALKLRLQMAQQIRRFAVDTLQLPDNASYHRYAQLHRRAVVWNVVAAPPYSLTLKTWCFPVTGCVGYRGYFDEHDAQSEADTMRTQGLESSVYGVPAYSTLGWTNWLGGDPVLSTFINYPQGELARMIFHELAHQVLYVKGDTAFNESFATAVERLGSSAWLAGPAGATAQSEYTAYDARRKAFRQLTKRTREKLVAIYAQADSTTVSADQMEVQKTAAYAEFRQAYAQLKVQWGGYTGYDLWAAHANNAAFGAMAAYDDWVSAFEALYYQEHRDWAAFYTAAKRLAALPRDERTAQLQLLKGMEK